MYNETRQRKQYTTGTAFTTPRMAETTLTRTVTGAHQERGVNKNIELACRDSPNKVTKNRLSGNDDEERNKALKGES